MVRFFRSAAASATRRLLNRPGSRAWSTRRATRWYRGSPIGRERKTEELSRASVEDINIEGHSGFIAIGETPGAGNQQSIASLCEVGIQFQDDFIEWSISFAEEPYPDPCDVAKELTRQSIVNSK